MVNQGKKIIFVLFITALFLISGKIYSQDRPPDALKVFLNYASPNSETRFKEKYNAVLDVDLSYNRFFFKHVFAGVSFDYSNFKIDQSKLTYTLNTKMHVVSPSLVIGYNYEIFKDVFINGAVKGGYSWVVFRNENYSDMAKDENNSGFSVNPLIEISYRINECLNVGFQFSYKLIFCYFGNDVGYDTREDSNIRYLTYGISTSINF
jgi:hypothetical protein